MGRVRWLAGLVVLAVIGATVAAIWSARLPRMIELAPLVADGMVLQRETRVTITGHARAGWPVVLAGTWGAATIAHADAHGGWRAELRTRGAGGPYRLLVWAGDTKVVRDVWIGETWLCSGQSNMAIAMRQAEPGRMPDVPPAIPIHLFTVGLAIADTPQTSCAGEWRPATTDSVTAFSAACWHFGRALHAALDVPIGLVAAAVPGADIEGWTSERALRELPEIASALDAHHRAPSGMTAAGGVHSGGLLFNAMIAPLAPYTLAGVVWYQGEANIPRAAQYGRVFPVMIRDWRTWFGRELAFGFVQLPGYSRFRWRGAMAELRDAQRKALALPNTGMVVTLDIADDKDIHSTNKTVLGKRLADWALARIYGRPDHPASGPLFREMRIQPGGAKILFDHAEGGLVVAKPPLGGFEIAGEDRTFHAAWAALAGDAVLVRSPSVPKPVAVRYAWNDVPVAVLRNKAGLPASPFRTDDWPGVTDRATWPKTQSLGFSPTGDPEEPSVAPDGVTP